MKTLSTNVTNGKGGGSEAVYLAEIDLGSSTYLRYSTKNTYDFTVAWTGDGFAAARVHKFGVIDFNIGLDSDSFVSDIADFELYLINHDDYHTTLTGYNIYNRSIDIRLIFSDQSSPTWANACKLFKGIIYDWEYNKEYIVIKCTSNEKKRHKKLPLSVFNTTDYPNCASSVIGKPIPFIFGAATDPDSDFYKGVDLFKAFCIDQFAGVYAPCSHDCDDSGSLYYWDGGMLAFGLVEFQTTDVGYTISIPSYQVFENSVWIASRMLQVPTAADAGNDFKDSWKIHDLDQTTKINMDKTSSKDQVAVLLKQPPIGNVTSVSLRRKYTWSSAPVNDVIRTRVYTDEFATVMKSIDETANKVFGTDDLGITTEYNASTKNGLGIVVYFIDGGDNRNVDVYEVSLRFNVRGISLPDIIYCTPDGLEYGSWLFGRSVGKSIGDLIDIGPFVVNAILQDSTIGLGLTSSDVDTASFDAAGNTTNGTRKDWKLQGQQCDLVDSRELLKVMAKELGCVLYENCEGKIEIKAINLSESAAATITGASIAVDEDNSSTLERSLTRLENVYNDFELLYQVNYANNEHQKRLYCNAAGKSSGIASGYDTKCANSVTKYGFTQKLTFKADWVRDDTTATALIQFLVDWFTNRREIVTFKASLALCNLELGDVCTINNTFVNDTYMLIGITHDCETDQIKLKWIEL